MNPTGKRKTNGSMFDKAVIDAIIKDFKCRKISATAFSKMVGAPVNQMHYWLHGARKSISLAMAARICKVLGISMDNVLGFNDESHRNSP